MNAYQNWLQWRKDRGSELASPYGWLSLTGLHYLPSTPQQLPGVPGLWSHSERGAHLRVTAEEFTLRDHATAPAGEYSWDVEEAQSLTIGSFLPAGRETNQEIHIELARRTGRLLIRTRDPLAPARAQFSGVVPSFDYSAQWNLTAPVSWYEEPRDVVVQAAQTGLEHHVTAVGEVTLSHGERTAQLTLVGQTPGEPAQLLFTDGRGPQLPWRVVTAQPVGESLVRIDFNRASNLPFAFSEFGTCPAPIAGNELPFAVSAGELVPQ